MTAHIDTFAWPQKYEIKPHCQDPSASSTIMICERTSEGTSHPARWNPCQQSKRVFLYSSEKFTISFAPRYSSAVLRDAARNYTIKLILGKLLLSYARSNIRTASRISREGLSQEIFACDIHRITSNCVEAKYNSTFLFSSYLGRG